MRFLFLLHKYHEPMEYSQVRVRIRVRIRVRVRVRVRVSVRDRVGVRANPNPSPSPSQNTMAAAADLERRFASFSSSVSTRLRDARQAEAAPGAPPPVHKWGAEERQLSATLHEKRAEVLHLGLGLG